MNKESLALVSTFDEARAKGDSVTEAPGKVSKALQLGDKQGSNDAVKALDVLAVKGTSTLETQARMLGLGIEADKAGKAIVEGMYEGKAGVRGLRDEAERLRQGLEQVAIAAGSMSSAFDQAAKARAASIDKGALTDTFGKLFENTPSGGITRTASGQLTPPDDSGDWFLNTARRREGQFGLGVWQLTPAARARRDAATALADARQRPWRLHRRRGLQPVRPGRLYDACTFARSVIRHAVVDWPDGRRVRGAPGRQQRAGDVGRCRQRR